MVLILFPKEHLACVIPLVFHSSITVQFLVMLYIASEIRIFIWASKVKSRMKENKIAI